MLSALARFLLVMGPIFLLMGVIGFIPDGDRKTTPISTMLRHPVRNRIRAYPYPVGEYISTLTLGAPYLYLIGVAMLAAGIGFAVRDLLV